MSSFNVDSKQIVHLIQTFTGYVDAEILLRPTKDEPNVQYEKSHKKALEFRELGEKAYASGRRDEALKYYTQGIACSPDRSLSLAIAYVDRSKLLFETNYFDLGMMDAYRAAAIENVPSSSIKKVGRDPLDFSGEIDYFALAIEHDKSLYKPLMEHKIRKHLTRFVDAFNEDNLTDLIVKDETVDPVWRSTFENPELGPCVSTKVRIPRDDNGRRRWIAAEDIEPGEVISNEEYYATSITLDETDHNYCSYCNIWCEALIPCPTCSLEMYCSSNCRQKAFDQYHKLECELLPWIRTLSKKAEALLTLRIFLIGTNQGTYTDHLQKVVYHDRIFGSREGFTDESRYQQILNLVWNSEINPLPLIHTELVADVARIFVAMRYSPRNFFLVDPSELEIEESEAIGGSIGNKLSAKETLVALLLLHHAALVTMNSVPVMAQYLNRRMIIELKKVAIGLPFHQAVLQHSCNPQVEIITGRRNQLAVSVRVIKKGEEIFTSYHGNYGSTSLEKRKETLKKYGITCSCIACEEEWDTLDILRKSGDVLQNLPVERQDRKRMARYVKATQEIIKTIDGVHAWVVKKVFTDKDYYKYKETHWETLRRFLKHYRKYLREPSPTIYMCEQLIKCMMYKKNRLQLDSIAKSLMECSCYAHVAEKYGRGAQDDAPRAMDILPQAVDVPPRDVYVPPPTMDVPPPTLDDLRPAMDIIQPAMNVPRRATDFPRRPIYVPPRAMDVLPGPMDVPSCSTGEPSPTMNVLRPMDILRPAMNVPPPTMDVLSPTMDVPPPATDVLRRATDDPSPIMDVFQPAMDVLWRAMDDPSPTMDVLQPAMDLLRRAMDVPSPTMDVVRPAMNLLRRAMDVPSPTMDVLQPVMDLLRRAMEVPSPTMDVLQPAMDLLRRAIEVPSPTMDVLQPAVDHLRRAMDVSPRAIDVPSHSMDVPPEAIDVYPDAMDVPEDSDSE